MSVWWDDPQKANEVFSLSFWFGCGVLVSWHVKASCWYSAKPKRRLIGKRVSNRSFCPCGLFPSPSMWFVGMYRARNTDQAAMPWGRNLIQGFSCTLRCASSLNRVWDFACSEALGVVNAKRTRNENECSYDGCSCRIECNLLWGEGCLVETWIPMGVSRWLVSHLFWVSFVAVTWITTILKYI